MVLFHKYICILCLVRFVSCLIDHEGEAFDTVEVHFFLRLNHLTALNTSVGPTCQEQRGLKVKNGELLAWGTQFDIARASNVSQTVVRRLLKKHRETFSVKTVNGLH